MNLKFRNTDISCPEFTEKRKAQQIIHQLTLLSPSLEYLDKPLKLSNQYIALKTAEIEKLQRMKPIIMRVYAYLFKAQRDHIYEQLTNFSIELETAISKASNLVADLKNCISQLNQYTIQLDDSQLKQDYLGIISVNNLKIATIEQKIGACHQQIEYIDKFRTVTLHHLNDTVLLNDSSANQENEYAALQSFFDRHTKWEAKLSARLKKGGITLFILSIFNYLAATYHFKWTVTKYKEVPVEKVVDPSLRPTLFSASETLIENALSLMNGLQVFGLLLSMPLIVMGAYSAFQGEFRLTYIAAGLTMAGSTSVLTYFINTSFEGQEVNRIPYETEQTLDVINLGLNGSFFMLLCAILCIASIYIYRAKKAYIKDALAIFEKIPNPRPENENSVN